MTGGSEQAADRRPSSSREMPGRDVEDDEPEVAGLDQLGRAVHHQAAFRRRTVASHDDDIRRRIGSS